MSIRLKLGLDVWECDCGAIVAMGKPCGCGMTYGALLAAKTHETASKREMKRYPEPVSRGQYFESYLKKKK